MTLVSFKAVSGSDLLFLINVKPAILGNMTLATILLWSEGEKGCESQQQFWRLAQTQKQEVGTNVLSGEVSSE